MNSHYGGGVRCIRYLRSVYAKISISKKVLFDFYRTSMKHEVYCYRKQFHPAVTQELITCNTRRDRLLLGHEQHYIFYKKGINKNLRIYIHANYHDPPKNRRCHLIGDESVFINNDKWYNFN